MRRDHYRGAGFRFLSAPVGHQSQNLIHGTRVITDDF
jgi:hypothetical protein